MRGLLIVAALVVGIAAGMLVMVRQGFSTRSAPSAAEALIATSIRRASTPARYKQMRNPVDCSPQVFTEAGAHWADHCATCHENTGNGQSLLAKPCTPGLRICASLQHRINRMASFTTRSRTVYASPGCRLSAKAEITIRRAGSWSVSSGGYQLTPDEVDVLKSLDPKTPDDLEEERQEREFLNGGSLPEPAKANDGHKH